MTDDSTTLDAVLGALASPAFFVHESERITVANGPARALFGAAMLDRHYVTVLRQPAMMEAIEGAFARDEPVATTFQTSESGRDTIWKAHAAPLGVPAGRGVLVSLEDTTAMLEAGQMRRDFVANVSHELRTPLTALSGFIETLRGAARDDAVARERFLEIMEREAARMNRLVADLLSLSRVESEERIRPTEAIDLGGLLHSVVNTFSELATEAGVTIETEGTDPGLMVTGDPDQMRQVFTNLVENAIKYGGTGKVIGVSVIQKERDPALRGPALRVDVWDRGEGIDPLHVPRLTERFYRVDSHRSRALGGTGLGLAIVKHIISRHRGRLRVDSTPGEGTTFSVILPRA
ncbi:sensor histidine kinase [Mesobaculum littorinae]|uniref:sensor histidine kinase n=1 Tax=Mesobaculum littorinae TaxID=2486419 RepID=UPI001F326AD6|nr:ATP-binding protein [Mesobaculum littorinae]